MGIYDGIFSKNLKNQQFLYVFSELLSKYDILYFGTNSLKGFGLDNELLVTKSAAFAIDYVNNNYMGKSCRRYCME